MKQMKSLQQILLVDDDPNDRLLAARELRQEFPAIQIREAVNWQQFEDALRDNQFELVITDYDLRWSTGLDVLRAVKDHDPHRPIVMFTDSGSQEIAVEAMKAGLDDYVLKSPKHLVRLRQAVRSVWENAQVRRRASELEFRLQFLLNELNVGVFRSTLEGELLEASDGLLQLLGCSDLSEVQSVFQTHLALTAEERADQSQWHREVQLPDTPRGPVWLQISETLVSTQGGQTCIDGLVSNITDQKQTSAELRSLNQTLEQRVGQRTARLETLNQELEIFAFSISHDLRSPIRQIDGFAALLEQQFQVGTADEARADNQLVQENEDDPRAAHCVARIRMLTDRAGRMIDDLLQFSRTGRAEMHYTQVSMGRLVQEVIRQVESQLDNRTIHWQVDALPTAWGDRTLLQMVWQNLIENAVKYTRTREVANIKIGSKSGGEDTIFIVQDNGIGFDPEETQYLFGIFQRLSNAEKYDGTGVGLANVQRVIHRHQGRLWAEGKLDAGATFYFSIPNALPG